MNEVNQGPDTSEFRIDPLSGAGVIYAPGRARRANAFAREPLVLPTSDTCPFCPGNEGDTPAEVYRWPHHADDPWKIRIVPNRYPVVSNRQAPPLPENAPNTYGQHEVLIESPQHEDNWLSLRVDHLAMIHQAIAQRVRHFTSDPRSQYMLVFKNVGTRAGATLAHPHLQLVTMNYLPWRVISEIPDAESTTVQLMHQTIKNKKLLIRHQNNFLTLCPPVSRVPYELWVMPVEHVPYTELSSQAFHDLALQLQDALHRLEMRLGKVAHNVLWRLPPIYQDHLPWRIEILPRLTTFAGLELLSDLYVNPVPPELAASQLVQE